MDAVSQTLDLKEVKTENEGKGEFKESSSSFALSPFPIFPYYTSAALS